MILNPRRDAIAEHDALTRRLNQLARAVTFGDRATLARMLPWANERAAAPPLETPGVDLSYLVVAKPRW
jgi:hypothetical protein